MDNTGRISQAELVIMQVIWKAGGPISTSDIYKELSEQMGWDRSTVRTLLKRLTEKGVIIMQKLQVIHYLPAVSESDYREEQTRSFLDNMYGGSAKKLVSSLVQSSNLTSDDIVELRNFLDEEYKKYE
jgi:BlaI family penicillinase repressor